MLAYAGLLNFSSGNSSGTSLTVVPERTLVFAGFLLMAIGFGALSLSHTALVTLVFLTLSHSVPRYLGRRLRRGSLNVFHHSVRGWSWESINP